MSNFLPPLIIGDLHIPIPIIQGGMGVKVSTASLASAVANCGGAGTIASVGLGSKAGKIDDKFVQSSREALIREIREARTKTKGVIGVNILAALSNFEDLARTAAREQVDYIISGAGLPLHLPEFVKGSGVKLIPIVSSGRVARIIIKLWKKRHDRFPDAIVVEGPLAGGHLGFSLEELYAKEENMLEDRIAEVLQVVREYQEQYGISIPVIAAGGIFDGKDIARFLKLGVQGVQMGTRFVATNECAVPDAFKQKYLDAREEDIVLIKSPVGLPGRVIRTRFIEALMQGEVQQIQCNYQCLTPCDVRTAPYCIARRLLNAVEADSIEDSVVFAGHNVSRVHEIMPVKELMDRLVKEAIENL